MSLLLHVRAQLFNTPLLITPQYADAATVALAERLDIEPAVGTTERFDYRRPATRPVLNERTGIAIYPIVGSMVHRGGMIDANSVSHVGYTTIQRDLSTLLEDPSVKQILLDLDTPGGQASGIIELADFIRQASAEKPIWGIANTSACSGGYWIGAACHRLVAAPMASVGSIGVVTMHVDASKALDRKGLVQTFVYAGAHKIDGHPYGPLPDSVKADMQASVNGLYDQFVGAVADMRGMDDAAVRATEAGIFDPEKAIELGLVDAKGTLGETLSMMAEQYRPRTTVRGINVETNMITQAELDAAHARGVEAGKVEGVKLGYAEGFGVGKAEGTEEGHAAGVKETCAAISQLVPGNAALETFVGSIDDGANLTVASKTAARVSAATGASTTSTQGQNGGDATQKDLHRFMQGHAPGVSSDGGTTDPKEVKRAEIRQSMKAFNGRYAS